jgi:hypothetical protein
MTCTPETLPFILEVPPLEDAAVDALHTFLLDLLTQFENHYFSQLHRYQQDQEIFHRDMLEQQHAIARSAREPSGDLDFNGEIPF